MEEENILDLSGNADSDVMIQIVDLITDVLVDMADAEGLPSVDLEELRLQMSEVATIILAEMNFEVQSVDENGTVTATLNPSGIDIG
jgi:hypothetical protein